MLSQSGHSQSKLYFTVGTNFTTTYFQEGFYRLGVGNRIFVTNSDYKSKKFGQYWNAELNVETRINKILYGVTGLSISQSGYSNSNIGNISGKTLFFSDFDVTYLESPLLLRVNFVNAVQVDLGFVGRIPVRAILEEIGNKGNQFEVHVKENIVSSLNQFNLGGYARITFLINRFTLAFYGTVGQNILDSNFINEWPLGKGQSLFVHDIYPKFKYQMIGMKMGLRIK